MTWIYSLTISHQSFHPTLPPRLLWTVYYHPCIAFRPHAKSLELPHLLPKSFCFARLRKTRTHGTHSTHGTRCSTARWLPTAGVVPWHFTWRGLWCSCRSCIHPATRMDDLLTLHWLGVLASSSLCPCRPQEAAAGEEKSKPTNT